MKRKISLLLAWLMLLGAALPGFAPAIHAENIDQNGNNGSVSENVYKEITLNPAADAHVRRGEGDSNFGTEESLILWHQFSSSGDNRDMYMKFDLSNLERLGDHSIIGATLRFYVESNRQNLDNEQFKVFVSAVSNNWEETEITWDNIPQTLDEIPRSEIYIPADSDFWYEWDLTELITLLGDETVFSLRFVAEQGTRMGFDISSREGVHPPELVLDTYGPELESVEITSLPDKISYYAGEELDLTGLVVQGSYTDGVEIPLTNYQISGFDSSVPVENQIITVTAEEKSDTFVVQIIPPVVTAIEISSQPDKTIYALGEALDLTGLVVTAQYINGTTGQLSQDQYQVSGFDSSNVAEDQVVTVTVGEHTDEFIVQIMFIQEIPLLAVADSFILHSQSDSNYGTWDQMVVKRDNFGNTTRRMFVKYDLSETLIREPESILSAAVLIHKREGPSAEVAIHSVSNNNWQESSINWDNAPTYSIDPLAVTLIGDELRYYAFDVTEYVKSQASESFVSFAFIGEEHNATLSFHTREVSGREPLLVLRSIEPELESIEIASLPDKLEYYEGQMLDLTGLIILGHYGEDNVHELTSYDVIGFDSTLLGEQIITVAVGDMTDTFPVVILPPSAVNPPTWPEGSVLTASNTSRTQTFLNWTPAEDDGEIIGYRLWSGENLVAVVDNETLSYAVTGLQPETDYNFVIEAGDNEGNWTSGPEVSVYTSLTPPATLPVVIDIETGDFNLDDWTITVNSDGNGSWSIVDGQLVLTSFASSGSVPLRNVIVYDTPLIHDFVWTGKVAVQPRGLWDDLAVIFNYIDEENYNFVSLNRSNDDFTHGIFQVVNNSSIQLADFETGIMTSGVFHDLRIDRIGSTITVYLDGNFIGAAEETVNTLGLVGFGSANDVVALSEMKVYGTELIDTEPPTVPEQLTATAQSSTLVRLNWAPSTDDSGIKFYLVYRDDELLGVTTHTSYVDGGLSPQTEYSYFVVARDVVDKDSAPSATVTVTTLQQDLYEFPFSHSLIDNALGERLLQYQLDSEWSTTSKRSGTALIYLVTAAVYDPYYGGTDGTLIKDRILEHIRHMLVPGSGREPGASGSLDTSSTALAIQAFDMASTIPAIWNELTEEEKNKIELIMQAHLVAAVWGHDDTNNFSTGINQLGNFAKGWNPNFVEGAIGNALATTRYLGGVDAANAFLLAFDYDSFMSQLQAAGLSSIVWTFSQTGKTALEAAIKKEFIYKGHSLHDPFQWVKERALIMYNKVVQAEIYDGGIRRAYVNNPEGLPNIGKIGMAHEFDTIDGPGIRSDLNYVLNGWNNSLVNLLTVYYYDVEAPTADMELVETRYEIGTIDLIYKATHGYYGFAHGAPYPLRDEAIAEANMGYFWLKELWENVISKPDTIPQVDVTPPTAPNNVAAVQTDDGVLLTWEASEDNNRVAGYRIYRNGSELGQTDGNTLQYVDVEPSAGEISYTIKAYDAVGNLSDYSQPVTIEGEPVVIDHPPEWPEDSTLTASSITQTGAVLNWTAANDDEGVTAYKLYKDGEELATVTETTYTVTGLSSNTTYLFQVQAGDASDNWTTDGPQAQVTTQTRQSWVFDPPTPPPVDEEEEPGAETQVTISEGDKSVLSASVQEAIGQRPLIQVSGGSDGEIVSGEAESAFVVSIPYSPTTEELARYEHLVILYIEEDGTTTERISNGKYNPQTGEITFTATKFGLYSIVFIEQTFGDLVEVEWARHAVEVLASKGIINGTSQSTYSPSVSINRADFLALLVKTLGLTGSSDSNFDDISPQHDHYRELGLAKELGIALGTGDNLFNPAASISRQDMMALTARALELLRGLEQGNEADLLAFPDQNDIAGYARESAAALVRENLIQGTGDGINPLGSTTRAEAAVLLYRIFNK